jgi:hypothetical protein
MLRFKFFLLLLVFLIPSSFGLAQTRILEETDKIYVAMRDMKGDRVEGYLSLSPEEITVTSKDNQENSVPLKQVESVKLEKVQGSISGAEQPGAETYYSVRLQNSQEIFTLRKEYTFSLNTSVGIMTRTISPEVVQDLFRKDPSAIRDKNVVFSLEFKF